VHAYPMAASVSVAGLVTGPRRPVAVAAATPHAVYLATGDPARPALCLAGPAAVRVPCALVLARAPGVLGGPAWVGGGWVGEGEVSVGGFRAGVARWWRPPRPCGLTAVELPPAGRTVLDHGTEAALARLVRALAAGDPLTAPVAGLLGRGPGLTPLGDDVLAGLLVTLGALGSPASGRLGAVIRAQAPARTTFVSAALLHHAARGECVPELARLLTAAPDARTAALAALLRVGHTSGAGLARGVRAAQALAAPVTAAA
jgi:hypothetical protein